MVSCANFLVATTMGCWPADTDKLMLMGEGKLKDVLMLWVGSGGRGITVGDGREGSGSSPPAFSSSVSDGSGEATAFRFREIGGACGVSGGGGREMVGASAITTSSFCSFFFFSFSSDFVGFGIPLL